MGGAMTADAGVFKLTKEWAPGVPLDLGGVTHHGNDPSLRAESYLESQTPRESKSAYDVNPAGSKDVKAMKADGLRKIQANLLQLSLYSMLAPPDPRGGGDGRMVGRRASSHTMDLGRWFTQPCVIVMGFLEGASPVPLEVDGKLVSSEGTTVVRWVYPLKAPAPGYVEIAPPASESGNPPAPGAGPN
jgi:hypothetical protein